MVCVDLSDAPPAKSKLNMIFALLIKNNSHNEKSQLL